jgi:L-ascorbate metabolism protein UlaG (beta-lactamase superfamily)
MPKLTWIGHSAFLLEDDAGNVVAVDPFIEDNPVTSVDPKSLKPSTILLTHAHNDHVGDTIDMAEWNDAKVICTVELGNWLESQGVRDVVGGNHGGTIAFTGGTVKFTPAWHSSSYWDGQNQVANGIPAGLIVRFGGRAFYFAGDTAATTTPFRRSGRIRRRSAPRSRSERRTRGSSSSPLVNRSTGR